MKKITLLVLMIAAIFSTNAQGYKVGDKATDFSLKNVDGVMVSMADYDEAKGFIVIFTCNHCPYSIAYEDRIIALDNKFAGQGYPVIAVNPNDSIVQPMDSYSKMKIRATEKAFPFPYLLDADQTVFPIYGATRTPHVFVLQKENSDLIVRYIGAIDNNHEEPDQVTEKYVDDAVETLLEGKLPEKNFTKAIGCSIKVKK
ncbi:MAG: thioredoxin family protein [Ignavibacteria bacterium]|nr:thioredoxin family protein [Ignavibacteria bacterium]